MKRCKGGKELFKAKGLHDGNESTRLKIFILYVTAIWGFGSPYPKELRVSRRALPLQRSGLKLYNLLQRQAATTLAHLRTGHCRLNHYLHRFNLQESPYCECGYGKETVEHYLKECRRYKEQRKEMYKEIRGSLGKWRIKLKRLLGDPRVVKHTLKFVKETARFKTT